MLNTQKSNFFPKCRSNFHNKQIYSGSKNSMWNPWPFFLECPPNICIQRKKKKPFFQFITKPWNFFPYLFPLPNFLITSCINIFPRPDHFHQGKSMKSGLAWHVRRLPPHGTRLGVGSITWQGLNTPPPRRWEINQFLNEYTIHISICF